MLTCGSMPGTTPGAFLMPDSGQIAVPVNLVSTRDLDYAQLYVFLMTNGAIGPPRPEEIVAETTLAARYSIR